MSPNEWISVIVFSAIAIVWFTLGLTGLLGVLLTRPLKSHKPDPDPPAVTVVIAARDEAERIGQTVDHLLAVRSPVLKVIIIDDRSDDQTPAIVASRAEAEPRLELIRIDDLPEGWLGKPHALHVGAQGIETEWILFSDADTWIDEHAIAQALSAAKSSKRPIDHVAVLPGYNSSGVLGTAGTLATYLQFLIRCGITNLGIPLLPVGVGAFNLVRTDSYRAIGGHERLRFEVVDDVKLAILLQREGRRQGRGHALILSGPESVRIDWEADIRTLTGLIEKNFFAMTRFSPGLASFYISAGLTCLIGAIAGLLLGIFSPNLAAPVRFAALAAALGWLSSGLPMVLAAKQSSWPLLGGVLSPLMAWVAPVALLRSARATLRRGGVLWRGRLYKLEDLRTGQVW